MSAYALLTNPIINLSISILLWIIVMTISVFVHEFAHVLPLALDRKYMKHSDYKIFIGSGKPWFNLSKRVIIDKVFFFSGHIDIN